MRKEVIFIVQAKFKKYIEPCLNKSILVNIPEDTAARVRKFTKKVVEAKLKENTYKHDNNNMYKRFYTGIIGEAAVEEIINKKFIDWTIGESRYYNKADLSQIDLNIGVKSVRYGKFPLIHKLPGRPEIINIVISKKEVIVCGLATVEILNRYQNDDYILSQSLKSKGTKTAFYGFSKLKLFSNYEELEVAYYTNKFLQAISV